MDEVTIAYFIDRIVKGGTELQLVEQVNRLSKLGVKQILFCLYKSEEHDKIDIKCRTEIVNIRSILRLSTLPKILKIIKILNREKINIVQTYFFDSTLVGVLCGKLSKSKKIISCRRDLGFWYNRKLLMILWVLNKLTCKILVNSIVVKKNVNEKEKVRIDKIDIINNGIDIEQYDYNKEFREKSRDQLGLNDKHICIGIIANMDRYVKRVDIFLEAARIVISRGIKSRFFILGDGVYGDKLKKKRDRYGLTEHITFFGKAPIKKKLLTAMDIGVICSDSEGFSNSIMEYMASSTLAVATSVGGNVELINDHHTGRLFKVGDYKELAEIIEKICSNDKNRLRIIYNAKEAIKKYDWKLKTKEMLLYYRELLS